MDDDAQNPDSKIADFRDFPDTTEVPTGETILPADTSLSQSGFNHSLSPKKLALIGVMASIILIIGIGVLVSFLSKPRGQVKAPPLTLPKAPAQDQSLQKNKN